MRELFYTVQDAQVTLSSIELPGAVKCYCPDGRIEKGQSYYAVIDLTNCLIVGNEIFTTRKGAKEAFSAYKKRIKEICPSVTFFNESMRLVEIEYV